jgi:hypothetical protein
MYSAEDVQRFYRAGALGLRALQDRGLSAERFGVEATARFRAFKGELRDNHRLDLALRDGAANHPLAFAARSVFAIPGLAADEPFGPDWVSLPQSKALPILRELDGPSPQDVSAPIGRLLSTLADIWGLAPQTLEAAQVASIQPASRVIAAGSGAIIAIAEHMAGKSELAFADQVLVVTSLPALRQLAGIAAALAGSRRSPATVALRTDKRAQFDHAALLLVSPDALPADAAEARALAEELLVG